MAAPSRRLSKVREIVTFDGKLERAHAGQAVTITLDDEIDISRGDVLVHPDRAPSVGRIFDAHVIWMSDAPLLPGKQYEFKLSQRYLRGTVEAIHHRVDVNDHSEHPAAELRLNEVGLCRVVLAEETAFDAYNTCRATGALIVVDRLTHATSGAGMVLRNAAPQGAQGDVSVFWQPTRVRHEQRANQKAQRDGDGAAEGDQALLGVAVAPLNAELAQEMGLPRTARGLVVQDVQPDGRAAAAGIQEGDVIQEVNQQPVQTVDALRSAVKQGGNRPLLLLVNREGHDLFLTASVS